MRMVCMCVHVCVCVYMCVCACVCVCVPVCVHTCARVCIQFFKFKSSYDKFETCRDDIDSYYSSTIPKFVGTVFLPDVQNL